MCLPLLQQNHAYYQKVFLQLTESVSFVPQSNFKYGKDLVTANSTVGGDHHLEYHMRSAELHVTGFLPDDGFDRGTNAKLGCFLDCRIYFNNNHGKFICTSGAKVLFKNKVAF